MGEALLEWRKRTGGWLKDRYGVTWQIVPNALGEMLQDKDDSKKSERVMEEMLQMKKIDIDGLNKSYSECKR
jgi:predicted 3-demethylubiquinone-9 3-methyltransferase (glyoxalase superfamily)